MIGNLNGQAYEA